ncbi:MAG: PIG-L family deacetylase [Acidobacteria bacterium]|nr:PIG-L family deacetylase [Acidobacteriota bacterium]
MAETSKNILVVSAHAADFVWRAGGAIALYASRGYRVRILCLSFGERGESQGAWKQPGMTIERVKEIRRAESTRAAGILGAEIRFFDSGDYPIRVSQETIDAMVNEYRELQPAFVLTHPYLDPYNPDHPTANTVTLETRVYAQALGYPAPGKPLGAPPVFMFEPHQPEQCKFTPGVLLDVTSVWDTKHKAMESMEAQTHLWEYYTDLGKRRGTQAVRNGGDKGIKYAEAFERVYPQVTGELS